MTTDSWPSTGTVHGRPSHRVDLLTWPVLGPFLKWRHARLALQVPLFLLAALMLFDGFFGPQLAPKNLATTGTWLQYRGLVVLALLLAGNLFCMACPFMLPRRAGRWLRGRLFGGGHHVPKRLRNKWLAVALLVVFFYTYERYSLWASPWLTAWVAAGYFLAAFVIDTWFEGAAFCKYVCPLGQFNFFGSLVSPLEIKVRQPDVCSACRTKECIAGRPAGRPAGPQTSIGSPADYPDTGPSVSGVVTVDPVIQPGRQGPGAATKAPIQLEVPGCELWLFQERKRGNMDCTFCLDCIHACPYDNIGLIGRLPAQELWEDPFRAGIGRFSRRPDLAAMVVVLTFAGFVNAFSMIRPVYALRDRLLAALGLATPTPVLLATFAIGLIALPALLIGLAAWASRRLGRSSESGRLVAQRYAFALVPLGFGMWLAHYSFHFLTGGLTVVPVAQAFLSDVGLYAGPVQWGLGPLVPGDWLFPIEAFFLYLGTAASLITAFQIARRAGTRTDGAGAAADEAANRAPILGAALPWMVLCLILLAIGLWIMLQPMEMRGTMMMLSPSGG